MMSFFSFLSTAAGGGDDVEEGNEHGIEKEGDVEVPS
jgi:hypothetical protein